MGRLHAVWSRSVPVRVLSTSSLRASRTRPGSIGTLMVPGPRPGGHVRVSSSRRRNWLERPVMILVTVESGARFRGEREADRSCKPSQPRNVCGSILREPMNAVCRSSTLACTMCRSDSWSIELQASHLVKGSGSDLRLSGCHDLNRGSPPPWQDNRICNLAGGVVKATIEH